MNNAKIKIIITQSRIVKLLVALVFLMMVAYLYCVNVTAFNAASYEQLVAEIDETNSKISELESALNHINRKITKDMAEDYNLVALPESNLTFAIRNNSSRLTVNE
jgi:uncharacterized protein involved in cysteine biosynthesis